MSWALITDCDRIGGATRARSRRYLKSVSSVYDVAFAGLRAASWTRYLKRCLRRTGSCVTHVTCVYLLVAAAFEFRAAPRTSRQRHVSDAKPLLYQGFSKMDLQITAAMRGCLAWRRLADAAPERAVL